MISNFDEDSRDLAIGAWIAEGRNKRDKGREVGLSQRAPARWPNAGCIKARKI